MTDKSNFGEVLNKIKTTSEISFWTGAGISFNSGIPFVKYIIESIISSLSENEQISFEFYEKYLKRNLPFEVFMQTVIQLSSDDQILEIFERGEPNKTHNLIAQLSAIGKVKEIYTTNFDTLIEKALSNRFLTKGKDFSVYNDEISFKKGLKSKSGEKITVKIFKVHGSIDDKKTIRTSIDTIAKQSWMKERSKIIKQAFGNNTDRLLIVLGYSFSDVFDVNPAIETVKQKGGQSIYIILHDPNILSPELVGFNYSNFQKVDLSGFKVQFIRINTDIFMDYISKTLGFKNENPIKKDLVWKNKIDKWSARLLPSQREFILSQLFFLIHENVEAIKWNRKALEKAQNTKSHKNEVDIMLLEVSILHQMGGNENIKKAKDNCKVALAKGIYLRYFSGISRALQLLAQIAMYNEDDFITAKRQYLAALKLKEKIKDLQGQAIIWLSLSSCLRHEQKHNKAIEACEKSIAIRNKIGDVRGLAKCFQGLGNIYLELGEYKVARKKYLRFENLTSKIGDTWSNATANYKLAEVNYCFGSKKELETALKYCNKSLEVRHFTKNREYANAIYLKGKILYKLGAVTEAKIFHDEAYELRFEMPNKSDVADSLFDLGIIELNETNYSSGLDKIETAVNIYLGKGYLIQLKQVRNYLLDIAPKLKSDNVDYANRIQIKIENLLL